MDALPSMEGATVLDLGCGAGDVAEELARRGARVVGVDSNTELLEVARAKRIPRATFQAADFRDRDDLDRVIEVATNGGASVDGVWSGFSAAYAPDLAPVLAAWRACLAPAGWLALVEVDDLFGHRPLGVETIALLDGYIEEAVAAGRYDFRMGRKLGRHARSAGLDIFAEFDLNDGEFSFAGPAREGVVRAWRRRFERLTSLQEFLGSKFDRVRAEFLDCLVNLDHQPVSRVCCCIAHNPKGDTLVRD